MKHSRHYYVALLGALPLCGLAQPVSETPRQDTVFVMSSGPALMPFAGTVDVVGSFGSVVGGVIKDKPYSADAVTESAQILADGNRITTRNETRIFRDGAGRTRRELTLNALGVWQPASQTVSITIDDPVAGESYVLNPADETARKLRQFRVAMPEGGVTPWTEAAPVMRTLPLPPPGAGGGPPQTVTFSAEIRGEVSGGVANVVPPAPGVAVQGVRVAPPAVALRAMPAVAATSNLTPNREDLGEQVLEGVLARGSRQTQRIPAGAIGNERDIEIVAEEWYSEELQAVVLRRNYDPRFGETTYRLINVRLGEPAANLFTVPQGYDVIEERFQGPELGFSASPPPAGERADRRVFILRNDGAGQAND